MPQSFPEFRLPSFAPHVPGTALFDLIVAVDMGFSAKKASCGLAWSSVGSLHAGRAPDCVALRFGDAVVKTADKLMTVSRPLLIVEAPLSGWFDKSGNPCGRGEVEALIFGQEPSLLVFGPWCGNRPGRDLVCRRPSGENDRCGLEGNSRARRGLSLSGRDQERPSRKGGRESDPLFRNARSILMVSARECQDRFIAGDRRSRVFATALGDGSINLSSIAQFHIP